MKEIDWKKMEGLVPVIVQDADTDTVLMLGYMNREALQKTLSSKRVWFYSRSKKRLWMKGEKSGNILKLADVKADCDGDALLIKAQPTGPVCHTGDSTCFQEEPWGTLGQLFSLIADRKRQMPKNSYTASLFRAGLEKIILKVAEESLEVVQAAQKETKKRLIEESVDLVYHLFALLVLKNVCLGDLEREIRSRHMK